MAVDTVIAIVSKIAEYMVVPVGRQFGYIFFYRSNVDNLKTQLQNLEAAKDALQHSVDAAKQNGEEILGDVQIWLAKVDGTIAKGKEVENNDGHARVGCSNGSFPNMWTRHQLSRRAKKMAQEISEVQKQGNFNKISYLPLSPVSVTPSARRYEALESRETILNEIMQALKADNEYMFGVCGMGGIGKSTLIKELTWKAEQDGSFGIVVMATVTKSPDVKRIQGEIADMLGLNFNKETEVGRANRLRARIKQEKSILVILDDIWEKLDLTEVGVPFGDDHKGCKLLLTSRDLNVLSSKMGTQKDFKLDLLSGDESWSLFEKMAGDVVKDVKLQSIALEVAAGCAGLPLLISTVAKALKNKELYAWKDAVKRLTRFTHKGLPDIVHSAIELSYNNLPNDELKSLFLLIGSFGQTTIWTRYLLIYFWSLGLYEHADTLANARNRLYSLIADLKSSCLLLEGERKYVKMHDVVHEVANKIASRDRPIFAVKIHSELKEWPPMERLKKCYRMFLPDCRIHELPKSLQCPELEILVLVSRNNFLKVPDDFFNGMRELKVLYIGGMDCTKSPPSSLCQLTNLRALYLRECMLEDISLVARLKNLEILGLEISEIRELPAVIGQLTCLRLLDLSNCTGLKAIPAKLISSLTCLEELYMANTFIKWEAEGSKSQSNNATLGELRHLHQLTALEILVQDASVLPRDLLIFEKLERYEIYIGDGWKCSSKASKTLKLNQSTITGTHLDRGIKFLLDSVEDLCLTHLKGVSNVLYQLNGEGFPNLKHLDIKNSMEISYIIDSKEWHHSCQAFPNLESLVLHNLTNMKKICHGPLPVQPFTKLKVIKVKGCDKLENLLLYSVARELLQLVEVEISQCKTMSEIIVEDDTAIEKIRFTNLRSLTLDCLPMLSSFCSKALTIDVASRNVTEYIDDSTIPMALFDDKISFPNLESLKLSSLNLSKIWDDQLSVYSCILKLTSLTIDGCGHTKYLFSSSVAKGLVNLQHLNITRCGMLEEIFVTEGKKGSNPSTSKSLSSEATFPNLETLAISHMDNLKSIWPDPLIPGSFSKLNKMEVSLCQKLLNVFPSYVLNNLHNVETLLVIDCAALEVVFETPRLNRKARLAIQLRTITMERLPMLKQIWSNDPCGSFQFQNLCIVKSIKCPSLGYLFPLSMAVELRQLQVLEVIDCDVENIVAKNEMDEEAPILFFPQLTELTFWRLAQLRSFYPGIHTLDCPAIRKLDVYHCDKLKQFCLKSQNNQEVMPFCGQPLFSFDKVVPNMEELSLNRNDVSDICTGEHRDDDFYTVKALLLRCFHDKSDKFPTGFLQKFTNLENLQVVCSSFVEIFSSENVEPIMKLRTLMLEGLDNVEYICKEKSEIQLILQNLETLNVLWCPRLKKIISSSSSVLFQNLDKLWVGNCSGLVNIITSSSTRSLKKLRNLWIYNCETVEEIVASEDDDDAGEIALMKLEHLELDNLPSLTSFCKGNCSFRFPLLQELFVIDCPMMESFSHGNLSAPILRSVYVTPKDNEWRWEGELNTTIQKIFQEKDSQED